MIGWFIVWGPWPFVLGFTVAMIIGSIIAAAWNEAAPKCPECKSNVKRDAARCCNCGVPLPLGFWEPKPKVKTERPPTRPAVLWALAISVCAIVAVFVGGSLFGQRHGEAIMLGGTLAVVFALCVWALVYQLVFCKREDET